MSHIIYMYILVMAVVTYLIRMLPLTLLRKEIRNRTLKSFLYYVPYVTLAVMTFPAILTSGELFLPGLAGFITALILSWKGKSLIVVAAVSCLVVYLTESLLMFTGILI